MERISPFDRKHSLNPPQNQGEEKIAFFRLVLPGNQPSNFINFRFKSGEQKALPLSGMSSLEFFPGRGLLVLHFGYATVGVFGQGLEILYKKLLEMEVVEISEFLSLEENDRSDGVVITVIQFDSPLGEGQF
ncbi:MAG: hypothetical protein DWQ02_19155 [Bacteroidetes bacterium]|nr:MAG: hypothetical protein DWQ02_19155 [Bacteroidota bacterium]